MNSKKRSSEEGGFVLVLVAFVLVVLVGFVALGVDSGILYTARTSAQDASDAAALAGAYSFVVSPTSDNTLAIATATAQAKAVATASTILGKAILPADVTVAVDVVNRRVIVDLQATRGTFFAKALGISNANIVTHSVAEVGLHAGPPPWPKPFFLPNTVASPNDPCTVACPGAQTLIDPSTRLPTPYAVGLINANPGPLLSIKPVDPSDALQPSIFYLVDFNGGGGGAKELNGWIDESLPVPQVACGDMLEVEKGNKVGLKKGIDDLLGNPPDDIYQMDGEYLINGTTPSDTSKALVSVPIWDTCGSGFCGTGIPKVGGHQQIQVLGFATMFLKGMADVNGALEGVLINVSGCAITPTSTGSTVVGGFPLRLVRQ